MNHELGAAPSRASAVLELPGLYGPFTFPERLLQKIWWRQEFDDQRAVMTDGRKLTIVQQGKWNLLGGPDFTNARLCFGDGPEVSGQIELHLHANDWAVHRHAQDPAYDGVILHVVLFAPPVGYITRGVGGAQIPVLVLLPLLHHDLEEYAAEDAVELLANRPAAHIVETLGSLPLIEISAQLTSKADARWEQKVHFAQLRIQRLGWREACHQTALDILGYRFNRAPMLRVAAAFPLGAWSPRAPEIEALYQSGEKWSLQGLRPANRPRVRLRQYSAWTQDRPEWPARLIDFARQLPDLPAGESTATVRRIFRISGLRRKWNDVVAGGSIRGTRFDNLVCDCFLPLLAANGVCEPKELWFQWFSGDAPVLWKQALQELDIFEARTRPVSHGMMQGLLGWLIERERLAALSKGRSA